MKQTIKGTRGVTGFMLKPLVAALGCTVLISGTAVAQVLEEVTVTAQKREQSLQDVGIAVTAFTGDQLRAVSSTRRGCPATLVTALLIDAIRKIVSFFIGNEQLLAGHYQATTERLRREPVVLAVQDTTSLNYTAHAATEGLGPICNRVDGPQGLELHSTLAFTPTGTPLGLLDVQCWARDANDFGKKTRRKRTPIEQKESYKWLKSYAATAQAAAHSPATRIVSVGDREADIYELFELAARTAQGPHLLVRAEHNRTLVEEQQRLWPTLQACPRAAELTLEMPRQGNRQARHAQLEIRFAALSLCAPQDQRGKPAVAVWAVLAPGRQPGPARSNRRNRLRLSSKTRESKERVGVSFSGAPGREAMFQDVTVYHYRRSSNSVRFPIGASSSGNSAWTAELAADYDRAAIEPVEIAGAHGLEGPPLSRLCILLVATCPTFTPNCADYAHVDDDVS